MLEIHDNHKKREHILSIMFHLGYVDGVKRLDIVQPNKPKKLYEKLQTKSHIVVLAEQHFSLLRKIEGMCAVLAVSFEL